MINTLLKAKPSLNLSRNIVALQVELVACCSYYHLVLNFPRNKFQCCKFKRIVSKRRTGSTLHSILLQLATLQLVVWQGDRHAVVILAITRSTSNAKMLRHELNENVARITWPLTKLFNMKFLNIFIVYYF